LRERASLGRKRVSFEFVVRELFETLAAANADGHAGFARVS
jgi:hypothetical protein